MKTRVWLVEVKTGRFWRPDWRFEIHASTAEAKARTKAIRDAWPDTQTRVTEYVPKARKRGKR